MAYDRRRTQSSKWAGIPQDAVPPYIPLSVADMDLECSPAITDAVVRRAEEGFFGYTDLPADHVDVVAGWLERAHHWPVPADWLVPAHRIVQVFALLLHALTQPGDRILLFTPSYGPLERAIVLNDRSPLRVPLLRTAEGYALDREAVERVVDDVKLALLVNPHNPVGKVWDEEDLQWLADTFVAAGVVVVSDDVHADFTRAGHDHRFIADVSPAVASQCFTFTSPAKTFNIPGLETTHVVVSDPGLRDLLRKLLAAAGFHNPSFFSDAVTRAAYLSSDEWLSQARATIDGNLSALRDAVGRWDGARLVEPEGTFLAWLDLRDTKLSEREIRQWWAGSAHVVPSFGSEFGPEYEGYLRLNLATPTSVFRTALSRVHASASPPVSNGTAASTIPTQ